MHHHTWEPTPTGYECEDCDEQTHACNTCHQPLETTMLTCTRCIERARLNLTNLKEQLTQIPLPTTGLQGIRYDRDRICEGSDPARLPHGLDAKYDDPDREGLTGVRTAEGIHSVIVGWAEAWSDEREETFAGDPFTYLHTMTIWAAQTSNSWSDYLREIRTLIGKAKHLAGDTPQQDPVPCTHCGGKIVRDWTNDGLDDAAHCSRCDRAWANPAQLAGTNDATMRSLPDTHPNAEVTRDQARMIYPNLKPGTLRKWEFDEELQPTGTNQAAERTYRLADINQLHTRAYGA